MALSPQERASWQFHTMALYVVLLLRRRHSARAVGDTRSSRHRSSTLNTGGSSSGGASCHSKFSPSFANSKRSHREAPQKLAFKCIKCHVNTACAAAEFDDHTRMRQELQELGPGDLEGL